ncbi:hypothetical protein Pint_02501 [Pistacia integerrima]|uniref:Uncharacterized protein n=1 Tax=Pistacia integerrima TaxID=434235 RepID=A0ACC0ZIS7_9ROSI|nr:hypothetical protein Pint_02501 [Pistacia integerrima]
MGPTQIKCTHAMPEITTVTFSVGQLIPTWILRWDKHTSFADGAGAILITGGDQADTSYSS